MDSTESDVVSPNEVPSALINLAERIEMLNIAALLFRGWDPEIGESKSSINLALSNCRRGIREIKQFVKALDPLLKASVVSVPYLCYQRVRCLCCI